MVAAFAAATQAVSALCERTANGESDRPWLAPVTTLCVAAWTPTGGLDVAWMGDTLA